MNGTQVNMVFSRFAEACPLIPGVRREDWSLSDPKGQSRAQVRAIRDDIQRRVERLVTAGGWRRPA